jgi:uncharacterized protein (DUF1501 family)
MSDSRRDFLRKAGCGALSMAALASNMHILGRVSAFAQKRIDEETKSDDMPTTEDFADYKALVCVFLAGGIDSNNLVIPNHSDATISNYQAYANVRAASTLAVPQANLLPISVPRLSNLQYGFHPNLPFFQSIYNSGKMAVLCNVGNLVWPMSRATYQNGSVQKPYQLFSHSDQVAQQQTSISSTQSSTGWGGRVADKLRPQDTGGLIPMITSIAGAQVFTAGATTSPMVISTGALNSQLVLNGFTEATAAQRRAAMNALRTQDLASNNLVKAASQIMDGAVQASAALSTNPTIATVFPNTGIGNQLLQVARLISLRNALNIKRQIFFVQIGGWDTHQNQLTVHNNQLTQISQALEAFWTCINTEFNIGNSVTTFTLSDFSRTFQPSGSGTIVGTDHAWGTNAFIFGGSVIGGNFYGSTRPDGSGNIYPTLQLGGLDDTDGGTNPRGRWIPTTSVDQYAATLARWFGVLDADLNTIFPNLSHFSTSNLGFMA